MFEDSLFNSRTQAASKRSRWIALTSIAIQLLIVAAIILIPLLHPSAMPIIASAPRVLLLPAPKPPTPPKPVVVHTASDTSNTLHAPAPTPLQNTRGFLQTMLHSPDDSPYTGPQLMTTGPGGMGSFGNPLAGAGTASNVTVVRAEPATKLRISDGVSNGLLLQPIRPIYPQIAIVTRTQGTVVVTATIDKTGRIVGAQAISGPPLLRTAAIDAVKVARYRPYLLNGEPTEVDTTISVNFRMNE